MQFMNEIKCHFFVMKENFLIIQMQLEICNIKNEVMMITSRLWDNDDINNGIYNFPNAPNKTFIYSIHVIFIE